MARHSDILKGVRVLVTRPAHQAQNLCDKIRELDGEPVLFPTIEITDPRDKNSLIQAVLGLKDASLAIFFSQNAVFKSIPLIQTHWPALPPQLKIAAIGRSTAEALRSFGVSVDFYPPEPFNSESLLACSELQHVQDQQIILFQGEGGRGLVAPTLEARGAHVLTGIAYQRAVPKTEWPSDWQVGRINCIIATSCDGLKNLLQKTNDTTQLKKLPLLVVSKRVLTLAKRLGFIHLLPAAESASDEALIAALISWKEHKHD
jgi:uroporphyrinogen-III synthase